MDNVKVWKEKMMIPTYEVGKPEKYPVFPEKRVYQASSGDVYPNPIIEHVSDTKVDKEWDVIFLENYYIKIMVLPALGGRIQMAYDKIRQRHFVYYNHVIKPALVGLTGPWISGGIEFNWPQHHRPSTYDPVDSTIEENEDGSVTVWVSEVERMFRTKGMAGFTLHPDKAYIEIKAQLYNRTPHPQTFLWWANPAVAVNDHYQSVFPPDVHAVFDHGKRDVSEFPIAKGEYYKVDYSPGTDISRYKNIPVPTSYMAITSKYNFVGGFENDSKGGLLHVADHHISPGKKQWTWGDGDFGRAWDRNLTDEDGPYIELMCGVYTDNQPDFAWMQPYEEKSFKQYFMPYYNVGIVKNATKDVLLNLEMESEKAVLKVHVTGIYKDCKILLESSEVKFFQRTLDLKPEKVFEERIDIGDSSYKELTVKVYDSQGNQLISWTPKGDGQEEIPEPAKAAKEPEEIDSIEQLYLRGLHLEQYRHATYDPTAYYLEALSREPGDVRNNNAMGLWYLKHGQFKQALQYFDAAIETLIQHNPNPYDGESFFNKGLTLRFLGDNDAAYDSIFKACWNAAWQDAGYFNLAQIDSSRMDFEKAMELIDKSLIKNWHNHKARHLKIILLRKLNKDNEAKNLIEDSLKIDNFNFGVLYEKYLISQEQKDLQHFKDILRENAHNYIEFSLDYAQAGFFEEAISLLNLHEKGKDRVYPMIHYFLGWYHQKSNNKDQAESHFTKAQKMPADYCFPNRLEEVVVLEAALETNPQDSSAAYYLGNFWYAYKQYDNAQECWEASIKHGSTNAICHRNLALLYYNKTEQKDLAKEHLEFAFKLDNKEARLLMELDQLYKKMNIPINERITLLEKDQMLTASRDDIYLERITLHNHQGEYEKAMKSLENRQFHPREGGEGKVTFQYVTTQVELAKENIQNEEYNIAIQHLKAAQAYPHNLGEGKLFGTQENDVFYWLGCAYDGLNNKELAELNWQKASQGLSNPSPAIFYNDQQPDKIFYQGLALLKLGEVHEAEKRFNNLIKYGKTHMEDEVKLDYFAVSLQDFLIWNENLNILNKIHCNYLIGLGEFGLKNRKASISAFEEVLKMDLYHLPAKIHLTMIQEKENNIIEVTK
ncbi:Tetratricopeptide repeat-containing protein [Salegentibacter holothuriorum]|uniref:Tetratricopeptide repeat-containing protein n=1 Tax=Salegentibacter holothuriorum TaxID=241145 RepID=A0A1T5EN70_9FLAO|nr:DUF5107 domain-containing protein [Salegentibacter holothuriorum]SKB85423.1 Tetratricopeptide repeat-containing protein [Salegentibacter holothuriorum]